MLKVKYGVFISTFTSKRYFARRFSDRKLIYQLSSSSWPIGVPCVSTNERVGNTIPCGLQPYLPERTSGKMMIPIGSSPQLEAQPSFNVDSHRWLCSPGRLGRWNDIRALANKFELDFRPGPLRYRARQSIRET